MEYNPTGKQNTPIQNITKYHSQIKVMINFQSDGSETYGGFQMDYNPSGKQITSIKHKTEYYVDYHSEMQEYYSPGLILALSLYLVQLKFFW